MTSTSSENMQQLARQIDACLKTGDLTRAEKTCRQAEKIADPDPELMLQTGRVHYFHKRHEQAAALFRQVLKHQPENVNARLLLWASYRDSGQFEDMLELAHEFEARPLDSYEVFMAYRSYLAVCDWHAAKRVEPHALELAVQGKIKHDMLPALLIETCAIPDISPETVFKLHCIWGEEEARQKAAFRPSIYPVLASGTKMKIAYLSADFKFHPVGFFMNQIFPLHDRERFEVSCYAHIPNGDALTDHIRNNTDHFIDITHMTDQEAATRIHADGIHILIDLGGLTTDSRISVLAYRPAPVQISYLGYPNTTGLPTVDFRITDHYAECEGGNHYVEQLLYMPQSFLCFGADPTKLGTDRAPAEDKGHITFGSFNNIRKLTPQAIEAWSHILSRVEGSILCLKARGMDSPFVRDNLIKEFSLHGISPERLEFSPWTETYEEHIKRYNEIDIALDTFPYNGTTTTCDALSLGIPVVTLVGKAHAQRVSYSILKNIGFEESIAHSLDEYVDKAVQLARKSETLSVLRKCLGSLFRYSILRQPEKFTQQLDHLYLQAWQEKQGHAPNIARHEKKESRPRQLHIGGKQSHPDWEIMDALPGDHVDHIGNAVNLSQFPDRTFAALYASHVLEHFSYQYELAAVLQEWQRVLIPGGNIYLSVPDLDILAQLFINREALSPDDRYMVMRMMFGGQVSDYDFHKVGLNSEFLASFLNEAGFENIRKVDALGIFEDTSNTIFANVPISLNIIAEKPLEALPVVSPSNSEQESLEA